MAARKNTPDDFWAKVYTDGPLLAHVSHLGQCWMWVGGRSPRGYGQFSIGHRTRRAHRVAWVLVKGEIPPEKPLVLHRCDNPSCVRPEHLFVGTVQDNTDDMMRKRRCRPPIGERHGSKTKPGRLARGERNGTAKLTENDVREIRRRRAQGEIAVRIAKAFGVCGATVTHICSRRDWKHVE